MVSAIWLVDLGIWVGDLGVLMVDVGAWMTDLGVWSFAFVVWWLVCVFRRLLWLLDLAWTPKRTFLTHCNNNRRLLCDSRSNLFRRSGLSPRAQHKARLSGKSCRKTGVCSVYLPPVIFSEFAQPARNHMATEPHFSVDRTKFLSWPHFFYQIC